MIITHTTAIVQVIRPRKITKSKAYLIITDMAATDKEDRCNA